MSSAEFDSHSNAIIVVDGRGSVLARSGPPDVVAHFDHDPVPGVPPIASPLEVETRTRLMTLLSRATNGGSGGPPQSLEARLGNDRVHLTLHPLGDDLVGVVITRPHDRVASSLDATRGVMERTWAHMSDAFALCTPDEEPQGPCIVAINPALAELVGRKADELTGVPIARLLAPNGADRLLHRIRRHFAEGGRTFLDVTAATQLSAASQLIEWELAPVLDEDGRAWSFVCMLRDANGSSRLIPGSRGRDRDPLTGLPNQIHFMGRLERSVERVTRARTYAFAVVGLHMSGLDAIQRKFGAVVCNTVVDALVWRVKQSLRPGDVIARVDDDRLAILLDHFGTSGSMDDVLERVRAATRTPFTIGGERIRLTAIEAASPIWSREHPAASAQQIMDELERAVANASRRSPGDTEPPPARPTQHVPWFDLAEAIRSGGLRLVYLPILSTRTEEVTAMEALVRCSIPERGVLLARDFIRDAERTGLAVRVGRWVTRHAFRQIEEWQRLLAPDAVPPIHINLSAPEFWHRDLLKYLEAGADEVGVARSRLKLEVTETTILRNVPAASAVLGELRDAGFETWLDRLGEGGLPLQQLPRLPLKHVKVAPLPAWGGLDDGAGLPAMLKNLLAMAGDLGWHISATGIETPAQWEMIREAGFESGQGFALFEPMSGADTVALLRQSV